MDTMKEIFAGSLCGGETGEEHSQEDDLQGAKLPKRAKEKNGGARENRTARSSTKKAASSAKANRSRTK